MSEFDRMFLVLMRHAQRLAGGRVVEVKHRSESLSGPTAKAPAPFSAEE
ncbi:hypothetical protein CSC26_7184 (plasmid) [Pseudomonas aeruginosa]|nr:hypothetical protein CSC26_7184 [Pseudomonas aeruginosa]